MRTIVLAAPLVALATLGMATPTSAGHCNCPHPPKPRADLVCVTLTMSDADWRACKTKSWTLSDKTERIWSKRYFTQRITVCKPRGHPNLGYRGKATGEHLIARFGGH